MALFVARERRVLAVGMFGGANDYSVAPDGQPVVADWIRGPFATPRRRLAGFSHTRENGHLGQLAVWAALGVPGAPTSVDGGTPPYGGSRRLVTSLLPRGCTSDAACDQLHYHSSTVVDGVTPRTGRVPIFGPTWRYMLTPVP